MPHITVRVSDGIDRAGAGGAKERAQLAARLQEAVVTIAGARLDGCRVRFQADGESSWFIAGEEEGGKQAVHAEIAIKTGRTDEVKARLSRAALDLLRDFVPPAPEFETYFSVEVREIDPAGYTGHVEPRQG